MARDCEDKHLQVVRTALDNFAHGRREFALQQLEALVGYGPGCSQAMRFWEHIMEKYMAFHEDCRGKHVDSTTQAR